MSDTPRPPGRDRSIPLKPRIEEHASVKLIGLGGVGGIVARYGAVFLGSLGRELRLVLIDGDEFEPSNSTRMCFTRHGSKVEIIREDLLEQFSESSVALVAIPEYVTGENIGTLINEGDIVLLAVDNHATRRLVSEFCATHRRDICLISGGNDGVGEDSQGRLQSGTYGNCQIFVRRSGVDVTPPLTHLHPEISDPVDHLPTELDCLELAGSQPQILLANLMAAASILNALWLHLCGALHYDELCFDVADGLMRPLPRLDPPC